METEGPKAPLRLCPCPPIPQSWSIDFQLDPHYHEPFAAPTWQVDMKKGLLDVRESTENIGKQTDVFCIGRTAMGGCIILQPLTPQCLLPLTTLCYVLIFMTCWESNNFIIRYKDIVFDLHHKAGAKTHHRLNSDVFHICPWAVSGGLTHLSSDFPSDYIYCSLAPGVRLFLVTSVTIASHPMALTC